MTREELVRGTRQLIDEGDRLAANPSIAALKVWLQLTDELLAAAWGSMDRYHLAWLQVGRPTRASAVGAMTEEEEAAYVREVATAKTAVLRMSVDVADPPRHAVRRRDPRLIAATRPGRASGP